MDSDTIFKVTLAITVIYFCAKYIFEYRTRDDLTVKNYVYDAAYVFGCSLVGLYVVMVGFAEFDGNVSEPVTIFTDNPSF